MKAKKNMMIGILCIALVFMGLGYSLYSSTLNLSGTATASGTFDVKITNVELDEIHTTAGTTNQTPDVGANYAVTETTLTAKFSEPGDYITWDITVTNRGSIEAAITVNTKQDTDGPYKLSCNAVEGTVLAPNQTTTFPCEMSFDKDRSLTAEQFAQLSKGTPVNMTVSVTAVQSTNYEAPDEPFEIPDYIINNDGVLLYSNIKTPSVTVPDSYEGKTITAIGSTAFQNINVDGLFYMDMRDEENVVLKVFPFSTLDPEIVQMVQSYGGEIITYEELLSIRINPDIIDFSGGPALTPIIFSDDADLSTNLTNLDLSNMSHLREIYLGAFTYLSDNSPKLQSVTFPMNGQLTIIGEHAFSGNNLQEVTLPNTLVKIGNSAFSDNLLTSINLPSTLTEIGGYAFQDNKLTGVITIPASVETIGDAAFEGSSDNSEEQNKITGIIFQGNNLKTIGTNAFAYNRLTGTLTFPSSLEEIGTRAFSGDTSNFVSNQLTGISFQGNNLKKIGGSAFRNNRLTGTLTLPNSLAHIGGEAFEYNALQKVYLGSNIAVMGSNTFTNNRINGSNSLTDIYVDMTESAWDSTVTDDHTPPSPLNLKWYDSGTTVHFN